MRHLKDSAKPTAEAEAEAKAKDKPLGEKGRSEKKKKVGFESFEELGLSEEAMAAVREMGIVVPTEIQGIGIPAVLEGKSVVLGSHTGSGKTLAYMLPIVQVKTRFSIPWLLDDMSISLACSKFPITCNYCQCVSVC